MPPPRFDRRAGRRRHQAAPRRARGRRPSPAGCGARRRVLVTDTTMRDAHQSLLATRMRSHDLVAVAARLCRGAARAPLARMLGRRDLRRRHALPHRGSRGSGCADIRERGAQHPPADAAPRLQRRRLHQLSRQRGALLRAPGGRGRRRPLPRLRLPQLGREHARLDGRGARGGQALRGRDLLHRRHPRSATAPNTTSNTMSGSPRSWRAPAPTSSASRTWPGCSSRRRRGSWSTTLREETGLPIHFHTHDTSGIVGGERARRRRGRRRRHRRGDRFDVGADLAALPRLDRRGARRHRPRHRPRPGGDPPDLVLFRGGARAVRSPSRATSAPAPRRSISTRCRAASSPTSRSRRARSASRRAGTRSRSTYADVNMLFGDIVKVTPSSKVVGDLALMMVASGPHRRRRRRPAARRSPSRNRSCR